MSTKLNLSNSPFRNRTLPWVIATVVTLVSVVAAINIVRVTRATNAQAEVVAKEINAQRQLEERLKVQAESLKQAMAPEERHLLEAAHTLVDRKQFSWSRLFGDLEQVIPNEVKVARINVRDVYRHGNTTDAWLDLTVTGKTADSVMQMLARMDEGGVFQAEPVSQTLKKSDDKDGGGMEWVLNVRYTPRSGVPLEDRQQPSVASTTSYDSSNGGRP